MPARGHVVKNPHDGGERGGQEALLPLSPGRTALMLILGAVIMLFAALTSVFLEQALRSRYALPFPPVLWLNTMLLAGSSVFVEQARRAAVRGDWRPVRRALALAGLCGLAFGAGQAAAWWELSGRGVFLQSNPHGSFFYLLTFLHALHLFAGIVWVLVLLAQVRRRHPYLRLVAPPRPAAAGAAGPSDPSRARAKHAAAAEGVALCAVYWHFLGVLWVYLFVLLYGFGV